MKKKKVVTITQSQAIILQAMEFISNDWQRCDDETGAECRGRNCHVGAHRAIVLLEKLVPK